MFHRLTCLLPSHPFPSLPHSLPPSLPQDLIKELQKEKDDIIEKLTDFNLGKGAFFQHGKEGGGEGGREGAREGAREGEMWYH